MNRGVGVDVDIITYTRVCFRGISDDRFVSGPVWISYHFKVVLKLRCQIEHCLVTPRPMSVANSRIIQHISPIYANIVNNIRKV